MDPMSSMYSSPLMYANQYSNGAGSYKTAASNDAADSTSSSSSSQSAASPGSHSGVDYDDDAGNYYMKKAAAARRNKLSANEYAYDFNLHRNDQNSHHDDGDNDKQSENDTRGQQHDLAVSSSNTEEEDIEAPMPNDDESYDHEDDDAPHNRVKRQVYYESGYDGNANCEGFPLEINVRSRIKLDRIFPIHGKSQMKKCIKFK